MIAFMVLFPLGVRVTCLVASLHVILFVPAIVSPWGGVSTDSYNTSYITSGPVIVSIARTSNWSFLFITSNVIDLWVCTKLARVVYAMVSEVRPPRAVLVFIAVYTFEGVSMAHANLICSTIFIGAVLPTFSADHIIRFQKGPPAVILLVCYPRISCIALWVIFAVNAHSIGWAVSRIKKLAYWLRMSWIANPIRITIH